MVVEVVTLVVLVVENVPHGPPDKDEGRETPAKRQLWVVLVGRDDPDRLAYVAKTLMLLFIGQSFTNGDVLCKRQKHILICQVSHQ